MGFIGLRTTSILGVREHVFALGNSGSAMARFERAVAIGRPSIVIAAAHELPKPLRLQHAIRVLLVLATGDPERFPAAAARFGLRVVQECGLGLADAQLAFAALGTLGTADPVAGAETLCTLLARHGHAETARYLGDWVRQRAI
jgi:hypothetical protein